MKVGGDFMMCTICVGLKEFLHGTSGQRATQDQIRAAEVQAEYQTHIEVRRYVVELMKALHRRIWPPKVPFLLLNEKGCRVVCSVGSVCI